jgi:hypothetical protein
MKTIAGEAGRLRQSGAFGRSSQLTELFDFLLTCSETGRSPKEAEIAHQVYAKGASFDPGQDALVRVHIHRLRTKLDQYYAANPPATGQRLAIPKGEYRLVLENTDEPRLDARRNFWRPLAILLTALVIVLAAWIAQSPAAHPPSDVQASSFWDKMLADEKTTLVIVGDRYLFGERVTPDGHVRLVRDEAINSPEELDESRMLNPQIARQYFNTSIYQIPGGVATALRHIMPVIASSDPSRQRVRLLPMSQVTADMMRAANIVYLGHMSDLGMLAEPVFAGSRFKPGVYAHELFDRTSGQSVVVSVPAEQGAAQKQLDFGYLSTFPGPSDNRIIIIAGGGDAGLMQASETAANASKLSALLKEAGNNRDFEAVLDVTSMNNMNMGSRIKLASPLNPAAIWRSTAR